MSNSVLHNNLAMDSDSEDDDYVPNAEANDSSSESVQEADDKVLPPVESTDDAEEKNRNRDALWSDFQASVVNSSTKPSEEPPKKKVKVEKKYRFAGKETVEVVEVDEDSPDAKQWPLWKDHMANEVLEPTAVDIRSPQTGPSELLPPKLAPTASSSSAPSSEPSQTTTISPGARPPTKRPGPRKSKTTLASLPGSTKAKRINTLDKSAMDWQAHLQSEQASGSSIQDELQANRRGGGYLEKVEFLKRVEDRKDEQLDALKSSKRRKL